MFSKGNIFTPKNCLFQEMIIFSLGRKLNSINYIYTVKLYNLFDLYIMTHINLNYWNYIFVVINIKNKALWLLAFLYTVKQIYQQVTSYLKFESAIVQRTDNVREFFFHLTDTGENVQKWTRVFSTRR